MKITIDGVRRDETPEEIAEREAFEKERERQYWTAVSYDDAVNERIRQRYTQSQEFAVLRQRDEKPREYAAYFAYCEECKAYVKKQMAKYR